MLAKKGQPLNVNVAKGSVAEKIYKTVGGLPVIPEELAKGFRATPSHDLIFHGGKTIPNLTFANFYVGESSSWIQSDIASIDQALSAAMSDKDLNNVMVQYFPGNNITSTLKNSEVLSSAGPNTVFKNDIENLVSNLYSNNKLNSYDLGNTVFNFMLPHGTILSDSDSSNQEFKSSDERKTKLEASGIPDKEEADSLHGLGGYHGSIHIQGKGNANVAIYYAVGVYSEKLPNGTNNGIPVFDKPWKNVTATFYHELNEARTDPDVEDAIKAGNSPNALKFLGWVDRYGSECGDYPVAEAKSLTDVFKEVSLTDGNGTVPVQFQYSNAVHGPEGPISTPH